MKSSLMVLAAMALGTAAAAQDTTMQPGTAPMGAPTTPTTPDASMPTTPAPTDSTAPAPAPSDPGMSAPAPASAPMASNAGTQTAMSDYPTCSRTVTDKCVQKGGMDMKHKMHRK